MAIIPCKSDTRLRKLILEYAEDLKTQAHKLGSHGLGEKEFYNSGLFRGAIERIRGQYSATMRPKREFVRHVLNYMEDRGFIRSWESAGEANRHDYMVTLNSGKKAAIELKGALDGNNTTIFERPASAQEFIIWSVSTNAAGDPRRNAWSGIHTRLSADIISRNQQVDGVMIWDMVCGTIARPCPKWEKGPHRMTEVGPFELPPPCIYVLPATVPHPRTNPHPNAQPLGDVGLLDAFHRCFQGQDDEVYYVSFEVVHRGTETLRTTRVMRNGHVEIESEPTAIRRG